MDLLKLKQTAVLNKPAAHGAPLMQVAFKANDADFLVHESLGFSFDGEGEHLYLHIRKRGLNTNDVLLHLQNAFKVGSADIGLCGQKDKHGITEQWFSVRSKLSANEAGLQVKFGLPNLTELELADQQPLQQHIAAGAFFVIESHRHGKKLRHGAHKHNWFSVTLRNCAVSVSSAGTAALNQDDWQTQIENRLHRISAEGFANYFGEQRFGFAQQNLDKALRYFSQMKRKMTRHQRSMAISAARSALFNSVCAHRVQASNWNQILPGELAQLNGTASIFLAEHTQQIQQRCTELDIHPTGPLWGRGLSTVTDDCAELELAILSNYTTFTEGLEKVGLEQQRRSLRALAQHLNWQWIDNATLNVQFELSSGVYATSMLSELADWTTAATVSA